MEPVIQTRRGHMFHLVDVDPEKIDIKDIAHALSQLCRYTGHTERFYSVAQHSVLVSKVIDQKYALYGLLHDASEAYLGDVSSPLKSMLPDYRRIEDNLQNVIQERFGLPAGHPRDVKQADLILFATEVRDLMPDPEHDGWDKIEGIKPMKASIYPQSPVLAYNYFMTRYHELTGE